MDMTPLSSQRETEAPALPRAACLAVTVLRSYIMTADGEIKTLSHEDARAEVRGQAAMVCHAPFTRARLGLEEFLAFDLLELFAFVYPGTFCVPTPRGLAGALGLNVPDAAEDGPATLLEAATALLGDLRTRKPDKLLAIAEAMGQNGKGWPWTPFVFAALGKEYDPAQTVFSKSAFNVWRGLPEWAEEAPLPPPAHHPVTGEEARTRLREILGSFAEARPQQGDYAAAVAGAFLPVSLPPSNSPLKEGGSASEPRVVLAEAGTGVGKTLGYLAPASVWAEKNEGAVWIATYTKNLQRQIENELERLFPDKTVREQKVAIRKGRENYLCLLNFEDTAAGAGLARYPQQAIAAGLMARWIEVTKDGDITGGDFPGWLPGLVGRSHTTALADRRGECVYGACDHYHRCFVERSVRKSQRASLVVANHALVMILTADSGPESTLPKRYVFDEGHHLFDAADSAYAGHLTAQETRDLRRWLLGSEGGRRSRARGLRRRVEELVEGDAAGEGALSAIEMAARGLTGDGWTKRLKAGMPSGPAEKFLFAVYNQVRARAGGLDGPYSLECHTHPVTEDVTASAEELRKALADIRKPMMTLHRSLYAQLTDDQGEMSPETRRRIDSVCTALGLRQLTVAAWVAMLDSLKAPDSDDTLSPPGEVQNSPFIDWMEIERIEGDAVDVGLYRHYIDPMTPFAASIRPHAHGIAITSATLRDGTGEEDEDWAVARERTGADYLTHDPALFAVESPFDYATRTKVLIVTDVRKNDMDQVAGAYAALFRASKGGALGLFTAIQRLRAVHERIAPRLEAEDMALYAQHADDINAGTLVDIFREDIHACLLGTDAVRDGIDVPGESLRLLVYDRVPWPRPTILHKARREAFGRRRYDELITRLRLKQAFGRLIRSSGDRGIFVMLDNGLPTRLLGAFPEGVEVRRAGLSECVRAIGEFLG
ncbi:MAG: ATP-dependent DNA helicase [Alphaproteobacteria bacterium]|nr:ATP-dependent DNA helicase [Alphaproteobacteria bacterium]